MGERASEIVATVCVYPESTFQIVELAYIDAASARPPAVRCVTRLNEIWVSNARQFLGESFFQFRKLPA